MLESQQSLHLTSTFLRNPDFNLHNDPASQTRAKLPSQRQNCFKARLQVACTLVFEVDSQVARGVFIPSVLPGQQPPRLHLALLSSSKGLLFITYRVCCSHIVSCCKLAKSVWSSSESTQRVFPNGGLITYLKFTTSTLPININIGYQLDLTHQPQY